MFNFHLPLVHKQSWTIKTSSLTAMINLVLVWLLLGLGPARQGFQEQVFLGDVTVIQEDGNIKQ